MTDDNFSQSLLSDDVSHREAAAAGEPRSSASYILPALDQDFLLGDSMRGVRFLLEYAKAEEALRNWGVRSTIVVFGSARVRQNGPGRHAYWYEQARQFGLIASQRGGALTDNGGVRDNVIATGGGPGLMEAANRGAHDAGVAHLDLGGVVGDGVGAAAGGGGGDGEGGGGGGVG